MENAQNQAQVRTGYFPRLRQQLQWTRQVLTPSPRTWRGAAWGALISLVVILLAAAYGMFGKAAPLRFLTGALFFVSAFGLLGLLLTLFLRLLRALPVFYLWVLASALPALALMALTAMSVSLGILVSGLGLLLAASLLGASLSILTGRGGRAAGPRQRWMALGGLAASLMAMVMAGFWLLEDGEPGAASLVAAQAGPRVAPLALPNPATRGPYPVSRLFYGSGDDRHRPEYGASVDIRTQPVDGSALIEGWSHLRTAYWGFGPQALPLNARVWYPQGDGPFPLVLVVHGQHPMEDFSDPGYAYLGETLASRGMIVASVDENFLNLSPLVDLLILQSLKEENDLRGWLLLEHLRAWRDWNDTPGAIFYQKVDLERIALMGHSRGGEAVAVAAAFNRLRFAPDNANLRFDYNFNIRSVVGIAPVYGTLRPAGQDIVLENVNYLVLHGAHDMDVFNFQGDRQYARVHFSGAGDWFKAAVYMAGANHGQFNSVWGRKDLFEPVMRVFNLAQLIPAEQQQQAALVTISAFLEATLHDQHGYRAFFQDLRRAPGWLPETLYLHQYQDARTQLVSTFEEDIDLTSTTLPGGQQMGENLTLWREQPARAKWQNLGSQVVYLGWDQTAQTGTPAYTVRLPAGSLSLSEGSLLVFSLANGNEPPQPGADQPSLPPAPVDLTIELIDRAGHIARLPLSHFALLPPQIEGRLGKAAFMSPFPSSEAVLQHFEFRLRDFQADNPAFQPADLAEVSFRFDRTPAGVIVLDNLGIRDEP